MGQILKKSTKSLRLLFFFWKILSILIHTKMREEVLKKLSIYKIHKPYDMIDYIYIYIYIIFWENFIAKYKSLILLVFVLKKKKKWNALWGL